MAYAGHTLGGNRYCNCGSGGDCICDAGEEPHSAAQPESNKEKLGKHSVAGSRGKAESSDFGQLGLLFALALLFWRLRF